MTDLFDRFAVIDVDTHLTEPPDLWTSRVPTAMRDQVPHVVRQGDMDVWVVGDQFIGAPGAYSMAGFDGVIPDDAQDLRRHPAGGLRRRGPPGVPRRSGDPGPGPLPERRAASATASS